MDYSKIMCGNPADKCAYQPLIPYKIYNLNVKDKKPAEVQQYACGAKPGQIYQCCDPLDPAANDIVKEANLVKVVRDKDGQYTEFHVCQCSDAKCEHQYCRDPDFKRPTQYELCRARAIKQTDEIALSDKVYKVVAANTYPNCYQQCKP